MSDILERLEGTKHGLYWDVARDAIAEITRLRTLLSEAHQREKDARREALEDAATTAEKSCIKIWSDWDDENEEPILKPIPHRDEIAAAIRTIK